MMATAARYGAKVRQLTRITDFEIEGDIVRLVSNKGEVFTGSYLVDGTGMKSVLATRFELRDDPNSYLTNSRAIFTHMVDVEHYDTVGRPHQEYGLKYPLSQSTLHHIFDGGWMWVIPFNNHADAVNPLCSVGLLSESREVSGNRHGPRRGVLQLRASLSGNVQAIRQSQGRPQLERHREDPIRMHTAGRATLLPAVPCRRLHRSPVLFRARAHHRYRGSYRRAALPFFRQRRFLGRKLPARQRIFPEQRPVSSIAWSATPSLSFQDCELWDAWFRVWVVGLLIGTELNGKPFVRYLETGDKADLQAAKQGSHSGVLGSTTSHFANCSSAPSAEMDAVRAGADPKDAAARIREMFRGLDYVPTYFRWHDPAVRTTPAFTIGGMTRMYFWYLLRCTASGLRRIVRVEAADRLRLHLFLHPEEHRALAAA